MRAGGKEMGGSDNTSTSDQPDGGGRRCSWLVTLAVLGVFGRILGFSFINYDDFLHVGENPLITGFSLESLARFWSGPSEGLYMPLTYTVWGGAGVTVEAVAGRRELSRSLLVSRGQPLGPSGRGLGGPSAVAGYPAG
jgi:hypothetical protein